MFRHLETLCGEILSSDEVRDCFTKEVEQFWDPVFQDANMQQRWVTTDRVANPIADTGLYTMTASDTDWSGFWQPLLHSFVAAYMTGSTGTVDVHSKKPSSFGETASMIHDSIVLSLNQKCVIERTTLGYSDVSADDWLQIIRHVKALIPSVNASSEFTDSVDRVSKHSSFAKLHEVAKKSYASKSSVVAAVCALVSTVTNPLRNYDARCSAIVTSVSKLQMYFVSVPLHTLICTALWIGVKEITWTVPQPGLSATEWGLFESHLRVAREVVLKNSPSVADKKPTDDTNSKSKRGGGKDSNDSKSYVDRNGDKWTLRNGKWDWIGPDRKGTSNNRERDSRSSKGSGKGTSPSGKGWNDGSLTKNNDTLSKALYDNATNITTALAATNWEIAKVEMPKKGVRVRESTTQKSSCVWHVAHSLASLDGYADKHKLRCPFRDCRWAHGPNMNTGGIVPSHINWDEIVCLLV